MIDCESFDLVRLKVFTPASRSRVDLPNHKGLLLPLIPYARRAIIKCGLHLYVLSLCTTDFIYIWYGGKLGPKEYPQFMISLTVLKITKLPTL